jgi:hypothetical protein
VAVQEGYLDHWSERFTYTWLLPKTTFVVAPPEPEQPSNVATVAFALNNTSTGRPGSACPNACSRLHIDAQVSAVVGLRDPLVATRRQKVLDF